MPGQSDDIDKGGTLRLGNYPCVIQPGTQMEHCYQRSVIQERHRHRYELNNQYRELLTDAGLVISGTSPDGRLAETIELADHPFRNLQAAPTGRIRCFKDLFQRLSMKIRNKRSEQIWRFMKNAACSEF